ncbi:MAG: hypothetical protein LBE62_05820 [Azonexus sp.]|nr:hypothetical protein [Azonexus sp.]
MKSVVLFAVVFATVLIVPIAANSQSTPPLEPEDAVSIIGPTAIGFFPPITAKERDEDDGGLSEGYAHLLFALEDLEKCLTPRKLAIKVKLTRSLKIQNGSASRELKFPMDWQHSVGIVLVESGREPEVVYATAGPSSLLETGPQAAWKYFSEPRCKRHDEQ